MTYNVHSCVGLDRRFDPERVARVIEGARPDVVALQEMDVGLPRSSGMNVGSWLARRLNMQAHFTCAMTWGGGQYGNAVLSQHPFQLHGEGCLPSTGGETRAVQWLRLSWAGRDVHFLNTHLSVRHRERVRQVEALLGAEWIARAEQDKPLILCGDFNASPLSPVYRQLAARLVDVQRATARKERATWPSRLPFWRIDHVFTSRSIRVRGCEVLRDPVARRASDHLPLVVDLAVPEQEDA